MNDSRVSFKMIIRLIKNDRFLFLFIQVMSIISIGYFWIALDNKYIKRSNTIYHSTKLLSYCAMISYNFPIY